MPTSTPGSVEMQPTVTADLAARPVEAESPLLSYRDEATGERVDLTAQQVGYVGGAQRQPAAGRLRASAPAAA